MMLRIQLERMNAAYFPTEREYSRRWGLDARRLAVLGPDSMVMHPGPMNRGLEISAEAADSPRSTVLDQVTNGVSVRMAVLYLLLAGERDATRAERRPEGGREMTAETLLIRGAKLDGGGAADLIVEDGVDRRDGPLAQPSRRDRDRRRRPRSPCPASSICTRTCASPATRHPRRC